MNFLQQLFFLLVYQPSLNLLQFYFNLSGDIGLSIILIGITVNLLLWPLIVESYLSSQKLQILQPQIKAIQNKYKKSMGDKPDLAVVLQMQKELKDLQQKHGINMQVTWQIILVQLIVGTALFSLVGDLSENGEISGLYEFIFNKTTTNFPRLAFNFLEINKTANHYLWLPAIGLICSFLYGKYTFDWSPKLNLEKVGLGSKKETQDKEESFDAEAFQASQKTTIVYFIPLLTFFFNMNWSVGVTLYFVTLTVLNLFRQIVISQYYSTHLNQLIEDIANSDPSSRDDNPLNNLEITAKPDSVVDLPVATVVLDNSPVCTRESSETEQKSPTEQKVSAKPRIKILNKKGIKNKKSIKDKIKKS